MNLYILLELIEHVLIMNFNSIITTPICRGWKIYIWRDNTMIHLVDIDESNWRIPLKISKAQELYVANSTTILARAYAYRNSRSRALFIYKEEVIMELNL